MWFITALTLVRKTETITFSDENDAAVLGFEIKGF